MENYNKQQQAVILKGIANQILSMNVPTFQEVDKLFKEFGQEIYPSNQIKEMIKEIDDLRIKDSHSWSESLVANLINSIIQYEGGKGFDTPEKALEYANKAVDGQLSNSYQLKTMYETAMLAILIFSNVNKNQGTKDILGDTFQHQINHVLHVVKTTDGSMLSILPKLRK